MYPPSTPVTSSSRIGVPRSLARPTCINTPIAKHPVTFTTSVPNGTPDALLASVDLFTSAPAKIAAVTLEEVAAAARPVLAASNRTVGWFEPQCR